MARIITSMAALLVSTWALPAAALPNAEKLLAEIGFSPDTKQQVLDGKFVTTGLEPTSERELAMAMAFLVSEPPAELIEVDSTHVIWPAATSKQKVRKHHTAIVCLEQYIRIFNKLRQKKCQLYNIT